VLTGISILTDFNFILAQNHMPAALWCQPQIALAARWVNRAAKNFNLFGCGNSESKSVAVLA